MDLGRLYNVSSLEEWENLMDQAIMRRDRVAITILTDYLRWIPKDYVPKSENVRKYLQHVKFLINNCESLVENWLNFHSCEELREMCNFSVEGVRNRVVPIDDKEFIRYVAKGCGVFWVV